MTVREGAVDTANISPRRPPILVDDANAYRDGVGLTRRRYVMFLVRHLVPLAVSAVFALPLWYVVSGALRPRGLAPPRGADLLPPQVTFESIRSINEFIPITQFLWNSLLIASVAVPVSVLVAALAGFGIRTLRSGSARRMVIVIVVMMLIPASTIWATRFQMFDAVGLSASVLAVIAPALLGASPLYALLYAWAFSGLDDEQLWAARLDGAGELTVWWRVAMPQVRPTTLAVAVLAFAFHWANFIDSLLYLQSQQRFTLPIGIRFLQLLNPTDWPLLMAGCVVMTMPAVVVFLFAQRLFLDDPLRGLRGNRS